MSKYRLEVFEAPNERLRHRRDIHASADDEAIRLADEFYDSFADDENVTLERYVLYDGKRTVRECKEKRGGRA